MSRTKQITAGLILVTIAVWIGWDIYVAIESTPGDTESEVIRSWAWAHPSFAFAMGALMGHFFWSREGGRFFSWSPWLLGLIGLVAAGVDVAELVPRMVPVVPLFVGIPLGALLWPQEPPGEVTDAG